MKQEHRTSPPSLDDLYALAGKLGASCDLSVLNLGLNLIDIAEVISEEIFYPLNKDLGISRGRFVLLAVLRQVGSITVTELAKRLGVAPASTSIMVKRLASKPDPLITREANSKGGYSFVISLTTRGEALIDKLVLEHVTAMESRFSALNDIERNEMLRLLKKLT